jgi:phosphatidylglycerol lysyltransferase
LWPEDKSYFFSSDQKAFIAYSIKRKVAICMGDPAGAAKSINSLLKEFKQYCLDNGWIIAFIQTNHKYHRAYTAIGLHSILIGADAVINLEYFTNSTIHNKYFRNLVNRYNKNGLEVDAYPPPHDSKLIKELNKVSESWITLPHRKEWSFLTGRFEKDYLQYATLYVLRDKQGKALAFANELPSFKPGFTTIDLMRHNSDAPTNSMDLLFIRIMQIKNKEGYSGFNLGMSPLDGKPFADNLFANLLILLYKKSDIFIGFKGLHQFKAKYEPKWEPRYVWYQGSPARLPQIGWGVFGLMSGS